jgi:hypothetical protein
MSQRRFQCWGLLLAGLAATACPAGLQPAARAQEPPQVINVCLDFRNSGLAAADQAAVIAQTQMLFTNAGFAPNQGNQRVNIVDAFAENRPPCNFRVALRNNSPQNQPLGAAFADGTATINLNLIAGAIAGANQARLNMAYGEVTAHEVGHLLSAVHQCAGNGAKNEIVAGQRVVMQCMGAATLMSDGRCIPAATYGTGMLAFNQDSTRQIGDGITAIAGGQNRNMQAPARPGNLELIAGQNAFQSVTFNGQTTYPWSNLISFTYDLSGRTDLFSLGWINISGQFVPALPDSDNPMHTLESQGGSPLQFALQGNSGTPFAGQVFDQSDFATISLTGLSNSPGDALTPGVVEPYYSGATVNFDVQGNQVELTLDTGMFGDHNGFLVTVPEPTSAALVLTAAGALLAAGWRRWKGAPNV